MASRCLHFVHSRFCFLSGTVTLKHICHIKYVVTIYKIHQNAHPCNGRPNIFYSLLTTYYTYCHSYRTLCWLPLSYLIYFLRKTDIVNACQTSQLSITVFVTVCIWVVYLNRFYLLPCFLLFVPTWKNQ